MADRKSTLRDAQQALELLEIQIEQYRFHLEGLVAQPHEVERARQVLKKATREFGLQRRYCDVLIAEVEGLAAKNRSLRVA
jgi:hypothetical protein